MNRKLDLVYFDAGGGHRNAARALKQAIEDQGRTWDVRLVQLQRLLDPLDPVRKWTGVRLEDVYNSMLKGGWTLGAPHMKRLLHLAIRSSHAAQLGLMRRYWRNTRPDLVVSLVPHFNRSLFQSLRALQPYTPYVTVLTDLADYPPHFWIEHQAQHFICGSRRAFQQAVEQAHPLSRVWRVSGMIVHPRFYYPAADRAAGRMRLGLDPDLPTGLVMFGGQGSMTMLRIAARMNALAGRVQLIMLCGRHEELAAQLRAMRGGVRMHVEGFTTAVPEFMDLADFFIGKPGPGSLSEALLKGLPVIVERNLYTLPQERYNADWVRQHELGLAIRSFAHVDRAVERLLAPARFQRYRQHAAAMRNRAVFEVVDILSTLLGDQPTHQPNAQLAAAPLQRSLTTAG